jgi:cobalt-zinc-cadmium efflux system protein
VSGVAAHDSGSLRNVHAHEHERLSADRRALAGALALVAAFMVVEITVGLLADSLAVLADAGHMLSDSASLGLALFAAWLAGRPATPQRSFGYRRAEILAALANGILLVVVAISIFVEAIRRLQSPPDVKGGWVLAVGAVGLAVNLAAAAVLGRGSHSLNVRAARLHVLADLWGSVGVIVAGLVVLVTGRELADPIAAMLIAVLIVASAWRLLRESVAVLLEAAPAGLSVDEVAKAIIDVPGVVEMHDLHVWTITSGFPTLSAHVLVDPGADCHDLRRHIEVVLQERFDLSHTTLQVDHAAPAGPATVAFPRSDGLNTPPCP